MTIKLVRKSEVFSYSHLLDKSFHLPKGSHFLDNFPVWLPKMKGTNSICLGYWEGDNLVATASGRVAELIVSQNRTLRVGIIGAVATDQRQRGKGFASKLLTRLIDTLEREGVAIILLWGSEHSFYKKLGFGPCGSQTTLPLSKFCLPYDTERIHFGWNGDIFRLIKNREYGLRLSETDRPWFESHKDVEWYWILNKKKIDAFVALGRGIDLPETVHEWGGNSDSILEILSFLSGRYPHGQILGNSRLFNKMGISSETGDQGFLGLMKLSNIDRLARGFDLSENCKKKIKEIYQFSPTNAVEFVFSSIAENENSWRELPLPIWIWGLDAA